MWPPISSKNTGTVSARPIQKRRIMSASSALASGSALTVRGSSAMPQVGELPGPLWRISGCIGQVKVAPGEAIADAFGTRYLAGVAANLVRHPAQQKW